MDFAFRLLQWIRANKKSLFNREFLTETELAELSEKERHNLDALISQFASFDRNFRGACDVLSGKSKPSAWFALNLTCSLSNIF